jgi:hexosaminidase
MHITGLMTACLFSYILLGGTNSVFAQPQTTVLPIIPVPVKVEIHTGVFEFTSQTSIWLKSGVNPENLIFFNQYLKGLAGFNLSPSGKKNGRAIVLQLDSVSILQPEGYRLTVDQTQVMITGHDDAGVFYGLQTLLQLLRKGIAGQVTAPATTITDYPRFGYRGMHLDVGRNLFPVTSIKKWIDMLALFKVNTFHWHLTDDQGWRIEIKKYPKLQTIAAYRAETIIGHKRVEPHRFDAKPYGGYYTQEEVKSIVEYATERHITIIPEIEMPGHAQAALAAYPALGCTGGPYQTAIYWGVFEDVYCAGKEETFNFLEDVLDEVLPLFPAHYIHIGGDECPKTQWKSCPNCQTRIKAEKLKDEHELQSYFIQRMEKYLNAKGREIIGWDEILEGGLAPGATVMSWRGLEGGIAAAKMHHNVIMTPEKYVYLDYYQSLYDGEQIAAGGYTPLDKVYAYEPIPEQLTAEEAGYIKGVQANVWSEYLNTPAKAEYMMFPRVFALAEIAWSPITARDYPGFLQRLRGQEQLLDRLNINRFRNFDEVKGSLLMQGSVPTLELSTSLPNGIIHYTLDGTVPTVASPIYQMAVPLRKTGQLRAAILHKKGTATRVYKQDFVISKATGKPLTLANPPQGNFVPVSALALVNGLKGSKYYNDGEWTGFSGNDMKAVIDLGESTLVSSVWTSILQYHWQKMWAPEIIIFEVSSDGKQFDEVFSQKDFTAEGINTIRGSIKPVKARYIKVTAVNKGIIPIGAYGAGGKAMLLIDEIIVN